MKIRSLKYYFGEALKSISRNKVMSFSSCATVAACMFIVVLFYCVAVNIDATMKAQESGISVVVYIEDDITSDQWNSLYDVIKETNHVISVEYIPRDITIDNFIESVKDNPDFASYLEALRDNPAFSLRRSFNISIDQASNATLVVAALSTDEMTAMGVARVRNLGEFINLLTSIINVVRIVSAIIILCLGVLAVVIITNTIKLTINSRRNEISIMKYIGSTDWFIRGPFVLEGLLLGLVGSLVPAVICFAFYDRIVITLTDNVAVADTLLTLLPGADVFPFLIPMLLLLGGAIGMLGSITTIRKYLDV